MTRPSALQFRALESDKTPRPQAPRKADQLEFDVAVVDAAEAVELIFTKRAWPPP